MDSEAEVTLTAIIIATSLGKTKPKQKKQYFIEKKKFFFLLFFFFFFFLTFMYFLKFTIHVALKNCRMFILNSDCLKIFLYYISRKNLI